MMEWEQSSHGVMDTDWHKVFTEANGISETNDLFCCLH